MTARLYYDDPHLTHFSAHVVERLEWEGQPAVVLDRTAFYPTGGGQPHDTGRLGGVAVAEVVERESDGAVLHLLAEPLSDAEVEGRVDWERRFDLMQQHTGQHLLSAAFVRRLKANTVGFHLSERYATIDLDRAPLSADELEAVEALANRVVFQNRPVVARWVADEEVPHLPLRKPVVHAGPVRVVEVAGFDCSACGGTHLRATGEVGLIKITRTERRGSETRVEFLCGDRARRDYQAKNALILDLAQEFSVGYWELAGVVHRLADDLKAARHELRRSRDALLQAEATALWHQAPTVGEVRVVQAHLTDRTPEELKHLAQHLVERPRTVALLAAGGPAGEKGSLTFARSADLPALHMGMLLRRACETIGGRGGGRPEFAQGGGPQGERLAQALEDSVHLLSEMMETR